MKLVFVVLLFLFGLYFCQEYYATNIKITLLSNKSALLTWDINQIYTSMAGPGTATWNIGRRVCDLDWGGEPSTPPLLTPQKSFSHLIPGPLENGTAYTYKLTALDIFKNPPFLAPENKSYEVQIVLNDYPCSVDPSCSGRGVCSAKTGKCICNANYSGPSCEYNGYNCTNCYPNTCSGLYYCTDCTIYACYDGSPQFDPNPCPKYVTCSSLPCFSNACRKNYEVYSACVVPSYNSETGVVNPSTTATGGATATGTGASATGTGASATGTGASATATGTGASATATDTGASATATGSSPNTSASSPASSTETSSGSVFIVSFLFSLIVFLF